MLLIRISLIIAIIAALAAVGVGVVKVRESIIKLKGDYAEMTRDRDGERSRANKAEKDRDAKASALKKETEDHAATKADLEKTSTDLKAEQNKAKELAAELDKEKGIRTKAQQDLAAWNATGLTPDKIKGLIADLKQSQEKNVAVEGENKLLQKRLDIAKRQLDELIGKADEGDKLVPLPPNLKGQVVATDPKWDFVVLNIGSDDSVLENGVMLVNRNGKLVGKIKIRRVQPGSCVANVLPGWKIADVMEGDQVLVPTSPPLLGTAALTR
jgi:hypothetical protein